MKWISAISMMCLCALAAGCGGGTGAGGTFGSAAETLAVEGWEAYRAALEAADYDAVEKLFSDALRRDPAFSEGHNGLGWLNLQRAGQADESPQERDRLIDVARSNFQRAVASNPDNADAWAGLSGLELSQNNWAAARDSGKQVLALQPRYFSNHDNVDFRDVHLILAQAYLNLGAFIESSASLDPNNCLFHVDFVDPGYRGTFEVLGLKPADLILKIEELQ